MKLVELLARELKEWPEDGGPVVAVVQDPDMTAYVRPHDDADEFAFRQNVWIGVWHNSATARPLSELATDHATAIVTRADWEAEKARIAGKADGGWIRHKRKSQPVSDGAIVEIRTRGGEYETCEASCFSWGATGKSQIMAYRIHKPAEQPAPVSEEAIQDGIDAADAGKLTPIAEVKARFTGRAKGGNIGRNPSHSFEGAELFIGNPADVGARRIFLGTGTIEFLPDQPVSDTIGSANSPDPILAVRDRIRTLDTQRAELEATYQRQIGEIDGERLELVGKLAQEGLALAEVAVQPVEDMSDWRNWKAGDLVEVVYRLYGHKFNIGEVVRMKCLPDDDGGRITCEFEDGSDWWSLHQEECKWHSRPGK